MITNTFNIKLNKCIRDAKKSYDIKYKIFNQLGNTVIPVIR